MILKNNIPEIVFLNSCEFSGKIKFHEKQPEDAVALFRQKLSDILYQLEHRLGLKYLEFKTKRLPSPDKLRDFGNLLLSLTLPIHIKQIEQHHETIYEPGLIWERARWHIFNKYLEGIRFVDVEHDILPDGYMLFRGVLTLNINSFDDLDAHSLSLNILPQLESGGLAINLIKMNPGNCNIGLKAVQCFSTDNKGNSAANNETSLQSHIAASYWQTYFATSEVPELREFTVPVAFFPRCRNEIKSASNFLIKKISPSRYLVGKDTIDYHFLRLVASMNMIRFNLVNRMFSIQIKPLMHKKLKRLGITNTTIMHLQNVLRKYGFIDQYLGRNVRFAPEYWKNKNIKNAIIKIERIIPYSGGTLLSFFEKSIEAQRRIGNIHNLNYHVLAAANSIFFISFPEEFTNLHSAINDPISLIISNGRIIQPPLIRRGALLINKAGQCRFACYDMSDATIQFDKFPIKFLHVKHLNPGKKDEIYFMLNPKRLNQNQDAAVYTISYLAFSNPNNDHTPENKNRIDFVITDGRVVEINKGGKTSIPPNGFVLSLRDRIGKMLFGHLKKGINLIDYSLINKSGNNLCITDEIQEAFSAGPMLMSDGEITINDEYFPKTEKNLKYAIEEFKALELKMPRTKSIRGISPTRFPHNASSTAAPRTAIASDKDGGIYLIVVDGRVNLSHSIGVTLSELARIIKEIGCENALNLDGGGSSMLFVKSQNSKNMKILSDIRDGIVNLPSDRHTRERLIPFPIIFYDKKHIL